MVLRTWMVKEKNNENPRSRIEITSYSSNESRKAVVITVWDNAVIFASRTDSKVISAASKKYSFEQRSDFLLPRRRLHPSSQSNLLMDLKKESSIAAVGGAQERITDNDGDHFTEKTAIRWKQETWHNSCYKQTLSKQQELVRIFEMIITMPIFKFKPQLINTMHSNQR